MNLLEAMNTKKPFKSTGKSLEQFVFDGETLGYRFSKDQPWKVVSVLMVSQLQKEYELVKES